MTQGSPWAGDVDFSPSPEEDEHHVQLVSSNEKVVAILSAAGIRFADERRGREGISTAQVFDATEAVAEAHEALLGVLSTHSPNPSARLWRFHSLRLRRAMLQGSYEAFKSSKVDADALKRVSGLIEDTEREIESMADEAARDIDDGEEGVGGK